MKVNQLGALAIVGVVVSFTAACNGSPTKPTALYPALGDAAPPASVNVSKPVGAIEQTCTAQTPPSLGDDGLPIADSTVACDSSAAVDEPPADVVVSEPSPMDTARFARRLRR